MGGSTLLNQKNQSISAEHRKQAFAAIQMTNHEIWILKREPPI